MKQSVISGSVDFELFPLVKDSKDVLFVTGSHLTANEKLLCFLTDRKFPFTVIHPPAGLLQLADIPVVERLQTVVAIGGGRVIDFAKGIIYKHNRPVDFIAAPTTAGSGSEATSFAVFYNDKEKISLDLPALLPKLVILDVSLLQGLSPTLKAVSGADAFSQCVESVWNRCSTKGSEADALAGLTLLWHGLPNFIHATEKRSAHEVLEGAHRSGRAIAVTRTTGPHALSYYLTAHHNVPHGQAVAFFLPLFFLYNTKADTERQLRKIYEVLGVNSAGEAFETCRRFFSSIGLATTFEEAGLDNINVDALLRSVNQERFANNPIPFDAAALNDLIRRYLC